MAKASGSGPLKDENNQRPIRSDSIIRSMLQELQGTWMSIQGTWISGLSLYDSIYENTPSSHTKFSGNVKSYQSKLRMKFETELLKNECEILKKVKVYLFPPCSFIF